MTATKKRSLVIAGIIVVILIGLFFAFGRRVHFRSPVVLISQPEQAIDSRTIPTIAGNDSNGSFNSLQEVSGGTAMDQVSYQQAAKLYAKSHVQFDPNCRVQPVTLVVPQKSVVMLDNQSKWQRSVIVGPRTYVIAPYNYVLAAFNVPGAYGISCDSLQDVGIINVQ